MTWRRLSYIAAGLAALAWAGCGGNTDGNAGTGGTAAGGGGAQGGPKLLFITNSNADWWNAVEKGMDDGGREFGCQVEMRRNEGTPQGQVDRLREALSLPGIQGVAVSVLEADAPGIIDGLKALRDAGKVVITIDSDVAADYKDARRGYIGTNNVAAGEAAGQAAALLRPRGGKVAVFVGTAAAANARERKAGFFKGAGDAFPEAKSVTWEDGGDHTKAMANVQTAVEKDPNVDVLLGLWSYNAPGIAEVVGRSPALRKQATVVTFDLDEAAVGHIEAGRIDASVCQNPYEMGFQGVKLLKALIEKDDAAVKEILPDGDSRDTGVRVIVPKADSPVKQLEGEVITIDEMKAWLDSKGLKSS